MHFCFSILETFLYSYTRLRDPLSRDTRSFPFPFDSYKIYIVLPFLRKACCRFRIKSFTYCVIQGASYDFFLTGIRSRSEQYFDFYNHSPEGQHKQIY